MKPQKTDNNTRPIHPLESLTDELSDDMQAVNDTILARMDSNVPLIPKLASYLIAAGGKRIRPLLTLASTKIYDGDMARAHLLSTAVEFIHTATLLHDDVVDESEKRRGQDAANLVFGNQASVLVGDFLFSRAFQLMVEDGNIEILKTLSNASAVIAQGEVLQLANIGNLQITIDDYVEIIKSKTAVLFSAACEVGPMIAGANKNQVQSMADYGLNLGIAFQIIDDILDYSPSEALGKNAGDDFKEGKLTAPIIFALQESGDKKQDLIDLFAKDNKTDQDFQGVLSMVQQYDGIEKSKQFAQEYSQKAQKSLDKLPNTTLTGLLRDLITYNMERIH